MKVPRTDTKTPIESMRILARDIRSADGVANAAIAEAADRLEELDECRSALTYYFGIGTKASLLQFRKEVEQYDNDPRMIRAIDALLPGAEEA